MDDNDIKFLQRIIDDAKIIKYDIERINKIINILENFDDEDITLFIKQQNFSIPQKIQKNIRQHLLTFFKHELMQAKFEFENMKIPNRN